MKLPTAQVAQIRRFQGGSRNLHTNATASTGVSASKMSARETNDEFSRLALKQRKAKEQA